MQVERRCVLAGARSSRVSSAQSAATSCGQSRSPPLRQSVQHGQRVDRAVQGQLAPQPGDMSVLHSCRIAAVCRSSATPVAAVRPAAPARYGRDRRRRRKSSSRKAPLGARGERAGVPAAGAWPPRPGCPGRSAAGSARPPGARHWCQFDNGFLGVIGLAGQQQAADGMSLWGFPRRWGAGWPGRPRPGGQTTAAR